MERQDEHQVIGDIEEKELENLSDPQIDKLNRKLMLSIVFCISNARGTSEFVPISSIPGIHRFHEIEDQSEGESEDEGNQKLKRKINLRDNKARTKEIKCLLNSAD